MKINRRLINVLVIYGGYGHLYDCYITIYKFLLIKNVVRIV